MLSYLTKKNAMRVFGRSEGTAQYIADLGTTQKSATSRAPLLFIHKESPRFLLYKELKKKPDPTVLPV